MSLAALAGLLSACMSGRGGPQTTLEGGEGRLEVAELASGMSLERDLEIRNPISERREDFLLCQFELHNKRGSTLKLEWTADWFDSSGFKIDTNENWRPLAIGGKGFEIVQITAPKPEAEVWRLRVQKPNPVR
ncbi:MAG: YcfL family protein [Planctomycetota bacterium]